MFTSIKLRGLSTLRLLALFGFLIVVPATVGAATVYYDNDYSSWNGKGYQACDYTAGNGTAYGRWKTTLGGTSNRVDTSGNGTCNGYEIGGVSGIYHKICQARPFTDPCSGYISDF